jgi:hypothetical protein
MSDTEWTTRLDPKLTRTYGVEELHDVCFAPPGWPGKGAAVSLGIPECELICTILAPDGEPIATVNRPKTNRNVKQWMRTACAIARERGAFISFGCDTVEQARIAARRASRLLPRYRRVALERMYDPATRCADKLS